MLVQNGGVKKGKKDFCEKQALPSYQILYFHPNTHPTFWTFIYLFLHLSIKKAGLKYI